jgi:hypothetical protein
MKIALIAPLLLAGGLPSPQTRPTWPFPHWPTPGRAQLELEYHDSVLGGRLTCDGAPTSGIPISIEPLDHAVVETEPTPTDENGRFELPAARPGEFYVVHLRPRDHPAESGVVSTDMQSADLGRTSFCAGALPGRLSGIVTGPSGEPIANATVVATPDSDSRKRVTGRAMTDARGHFALATDLGGYRVSARAPGYGPMLWKPVDIQAEDSDITIALPQGAGLRGRVVDGAGRGVPRLEVSAESQLDITGEDGRFAFESLQPGSHTLSVVTRDGRFALAGVDAPAEEVVLRLRRGGRTLLTVAGPPHSAEPWVAVEHVDGFDAPADVLRGNSRSVDGGLELMLPPGCVELRVTLSDSPGLEAHLFLEVPEGGVTHAEAVLRPAGENGVAGSATGSQQPCGTERTGYSVNTR